MTQHNVIVVLPHAPSLAETFARPLSFHHLLQYISERTALPPSTLSLTCNRRLLKQCDVLPLTAEQHDTANVVDLDRVRAELPLSVVSVSYCVCGGKGGFGTLLRGVRANTREVADDGAMRDLHGRRLRHVHDTEALAEWRAKQESLTAEERRRQRLAADEQLRRLNRGLDAKRKTCKFGAQCKYHDTTCRMMHPQPTRTDRDDTGDNDDEKSDDPRESLSAVINQVKDSVHEAVSSLVTSSRKRTRHDQTTHDQQEQTETTRDMKDKATEENMSTSTARRKTDNNEQKQKEADTASSVAVPAITTTTTATISSRRQMFDDAFSSLWKDELKDIEDSGDDD